MEMKILSPGMQDGEEADLRAQMFGVADNGEEGVGGRAEEKIQGYATSVWSESLQNAVGTHQGSIVREEA
jgi:hypothetical protein